MINSKIGRDAAKCDGTRRRSTRIRPKLDMDFGGAAKFGRGGGREGDGRRKEKGGGGREGDGRRRA